LLLYNNYIRPIVSVELIYYIILIYYILICVFWFVIVEFVVDRSSEKESR
jgi:hypothetical protein